MLERAVFSRLGMWGQLSQIPVSQPQWRKRPHRRGNSCGELPALPFCFFSFPVSSPGQLCPAHLSPVTLPQRPATLLWKNSPYFLLHQATVQGSGLFLEMISVISLMPHPLNTPSPWSLVPLSTLCITPSCLQRPPPLAGSPSFQATFSHLSLRDLCATPILPPPPPPSSFFFF